MIKINQCIIYFPESRDFFDWSWIFILRGKQKISSIFYDNKIRDQDNTNRSYLCSGASSPSNLILNRIPMV